MSGGGVNYEHAVRALGRALDKEKQQWTPVPPRPSCNSQEVTDSQRDGAACWLVQLARSFDFAPETYVLAIALLDRVSSLVKVRPKYLRCVAITCLFIAAKTLEDDEAVPATGDLVCRSGAGCSVSEVLRMEVAILLKLHWNPRQVTAIDFLHLMHACVLGSFPWLLSGAEAVSPAAHLALLTTKLLALLVHAPAARLPPSLLAAALLMTEMPPTPHTCLPPLLQQVSQEAVWRCGATVRRLLGASGMLSPRYRLTTKKRKVQAPDHDMYEGIKRLYEESGALPDKMADKADTVMALSKRGSCASQLQPAPDDRRPRPPAVAAV